MPIHFAHPADIPSILPLVNSAFRGDSARRGWTHESDLIAGTQRTDAADLLNMLQTPGAVMLLYRNDAGDLEGCVFLQKKERGLYLGMLTVAPDLQGGGIGKKLLAAADEHARLLGCPCIYMSVISVRSELIAWYERHGYRLTGETQPFIVPEAFGTPTQSLEFVFLEKPIPQASEVRPWKILSSRYAYARPPYMTLREDTVQLPNGKRIDDYFVFEYPDWVMTLAVTKQGDWVLIRQYRHGIGRVYYELAAGVADPGESLLASAQRELLEETGYGGGQWQLWIQASANPATHSNTSHIYLAEGVEKLREQDLDATEDIEVVLLSTEQVRMLLSVGEVFQALHIAALWKYFAEKGRRYTRI